MQDFILKTFVSPSELCNNYSELCQSRLLVAKVVNYVSEKGGEVDGEGVLPHTR
jgi:hypothetical protein